MKTFWKFAVTVGLMSLAASAQTASGSASGNASVTPGKASAGASANQSAQAGGVSANANTNASARAQASGGQKEKQKQGSHGSAGSAGAALSSGTMLQAELDRPLDAGKAKPGDEVTAKVTQDVKADGKVVVHKGSHLVGHVTEAQAHSKEHAQSSLGIVFDTAGLKGGQERSFNGMVQAIAPPVRAAAAGGLDESSMVSSGPAPRGGGGRSGGGGLLGGVGATATGAVSGTTNTVAGTTGAVGGTVGGATGVVGGLTAQGNLTSASRGAIGLQGLTLNSATAGSAQGSVISCPTRTVKLDSGTQMLLQVSGAAH